MRFYANIESKEKRNERSIISMVKGVRIEITETTIIGHLNIPNKGPRFGMISDMIVFEPA